MKPSLHVCSLQQALELKQLGITQESLWYWIPCTTRTDFKITHYMLQTGEIVGGDGADAAFTCAELRAMLPEFISNYHGITYRFWELFQPPRDKPEPFAGYNASYEIYYNIEERKPAFPFMLDPSYKSRPTQALMRADLLIWLLKTSETGVTAEACNQRLQEFDNIKI